MHNVVLYNRNKLTVCQEEIRDMIKSTCQSDRIAIDVFEVRAKGVANLLEEFDDLRLSKPPFPTPDNPKIIAVSLHCPRLNPTGYLVPLLQTLKELHDHTGYPILLAGDFNMDVMNMKDEDKERLQPLIKSYRPRSYKSTQHRQGKDQIDHIMLLNNKPTVTCTLGAVEAVEIDIPFSKTDVEMWRDEVSNHDPLITTLTMEEGELISVLNWNLSKSNESYILPSRDLLFLQVGKDVPVHVINCDSYSPKHRHNNRIYYKEGRFQLDEDTDEYLEKAYLTLQFKLDCITAFNKHGHNREKTAKVLWQLNQVEGKKATWITEQVEQILDDENRIAEMMLLWHCCRGIPQNDIKYYLDDHFVLAILHIQSQPGTSLVAVSFLNRAGDPDSTLNLLLILLKELRGVLRRHHPGNSFPILLAGDYNTDVFEYKGKIPWIRDQYVTPYNPTTYKLTECRKEKKRVDHILLRKDDTHGVICTLEKVLAWTPRDTDISEHDILRATLRIRRTAMVKKEPKTTGP